ncbi:hypothetical protein [Flavisphingomonas formosensis]|uniref:hypothetical protein n=1 Tax=Flavisphingomonas formosensis TaxID=861534 RepID=UPI0012F72C0D|nr:hypothetical protein [Sphingomonas formosensis]
MIDTLPTPYFSGLVLWAIDRIDGAVRRIWIQQRGTAQHDPRFLRIVAHGFSSRGISTETRVEQWLKPRPVVGISGLIFFGAAAGE